MVDLCPVLSDMLSGIAPVELSFPEAKAKCPVITLTELPNASVAVLDGDERLTEVDWQIDVWDNGRTPKRCNDLASKVRARLTASGMTCYFGQMMRDPAAHHRYTMRFRGVLDNKNLIMYRS